MTRSVRACAAVIAALAVGAVVLSGAASATATAPGANGRIAYEFLDHNFINTTLRDVLPGGRPRRLTVVPRRCHPSENHRWHDEQPRYSPDGNWIAYRHSDNCRRRRWPYRYEIRLLRADGRDSRTLVSSGPNRGYLNLHQGTWPVFSRDGERIIFNAAFRHSDRLWIIDAQSGRVLRRTRLPADTAYWPLDWSPGGRLALYLNPARGARGIFSGRPGAMFENYRRITSDPSEGTLEQWVYALDWSPNGASMLFEGSVSCVDSDDPACPFDKGVELSDIYRVFMKGGLKPRRLTRDGGSQSPVFSPDSTRMAFEDLIRGGIAVRRLAGDNTRLVGKGGSSPAWQPVTRATLFR